MMIIFIIINYERYLDSESDVSLTTRRRDAFIINATYH